MQKAGGLRSALPLAIAVLVHTGLAALLLARRAESPLTDPVMQVILAPAPSPRTTPEAPVAAAAVRRQGTPQPLEQAQPHPAPPDAVVDWRVNSEPAAEDGVQRTLRDRLGCRTPDALALTAEERTACDERLAQGAKEARPYAVVSPKLQKQFDGVFECPKDDVWCEYRIGKGPYPGLLAPHRRKSAEWD